VNGWSGCDLIEYARLRQLARGRSRWHDARHQRGEMLAAAETYIDLARGSGAGRPPRAWPWTDTQPNEQESQIKRLAHAGALIAAEIDRLLAEGQRP
jgi:hypothetical protein